jgi:peptidoglycan/LPS O-acetylase OafA/YrhL
MRPPIGLGRVATPPATVLLRAGVRLRRLDILRGIAVVLVLFRHHPPPAADVATPVREIGATLTRVGWIGVDLFFVLSGFLVAGLLFREHRRHGALALGRFWLRRGFKIYPGFYVLLAVTWWMQTHGGVPAPRNREERLLYEAVYVQNYWGGLWNHTWSLAVEEHFYLGLPIVLACCVWIARRDPFRWLWVGLLAGCVGVLAWRVVTVASPHPFEPYLFPTHLRIDSLLWGVLLCWVFHRERARVAALRPWGVPVAVVGAALLAPVFVSEIGKSLFLATWGLTTIAVGFTLLLAAVLMTLTEDAASPSGWRAAPGTLIAAIGVDSYSIYLWHMAVQKWVMPWYRRSLLTAVGDPTASYLAALVAYVVTAVVLGVVAARLIERPALALRDRLFPSRSGMVTVGVPAPTPGASHVAAARA